MESKLYFRHPNNVRGYDVVVEQNGTKITKWFGADSKYATARVVTMPEYDTVDEAKKQFHHQLNLLKDEDNP